MKNKKLLLVGTLLAIMLFSFFVRISFFQKPIIFPLGDGGMFNEMTKELIQNRFQLPSFTEYNNQKIPFSYPPFAFYTVGFIATIINVDLLKVITFFPLILNLLAIPSFFLLAKEFLHEIDKSLIATLAFSVSISSFEWMIMGGGITRSPAYAFFILAIWLIASGEKKKSWKRIIFGGIFYGLTYGFHIETGYTATLIILLSVLVYSRDKFGLFSIVSVHIIAILIYGPFLFSAIRMNGLEPFYYAFRSGSFDIGYSIGKLLEFDIFNMFPILNIAGVFVLIGMLIQIKRKDPFLSLWILLLFILEPRSFARFSVIPASILFSESIYELLKHLWPNEEKYKELPLLNLHNLIAFGLWLIIAISTQFKSALNLSNLETLSYADLNAFEWINSHIDAERDFIVIPSKYWYSDIVSEWFPALTNQNNHFTIQGLEWVGEFTERQLERDSFVSEIYQFGMSDAISHLEVNADYIYCSTKQKDALEVLCPYKLQGYALIYDKEGVMIFSKNMANK